GIAIRVFQAAVRVVPARSHADIFHIGSHLGCILASEGLQFGQCLSQLFNGDFFGWGYQDSLVRMAARQNIRACAILTLFQPTSHSLPEDSDNVFYRTTRPPANR